MACPYFYPVERLEEAVWAVPPRLPLGDAYAGECRAGEAPLQPEDAVLRSFCNSGYAREKCSLFPQTARADAVRFSIASDSSGVIRLHYVFEKGCWPLDHGELEYSADGRSFVSSLPDEIGARQAEAFMDSYLRRAR